MKFGWINIFGAVIVIVMMIPNIVFAVKYKGEKNECSNRFMTAAEQIGRYACIILMWLPLPAGEFGFAHVSGMLVYLFGNACLLTAYLAVFARYMKKRSAGPALAAAILPACVFLLSGLTLRRWLLTGAALLFAAGHVYVCRAAALFKTERRRDGN